MLDENQSNMSEDEALREIQEGFSNGVKSGITLLVIYLLQLGYIYLVDYYFTGY